MLEVTNAPFQGSWAHKVCPSGTEAPDPSECDSVSKSCPPSHVEQVCECKRWPWEGDLHNEHMNKLLKHIIVNMGPNLTDTALQRAARSVTALDAIAEAFDAQSGVPHRSSAHTTKSDTQDVKKVMAIVMKNKLLTSIGSKDHRTFSTLALNPLAKWDVKKTVEWIAAKKKEYLKYKGKFRADVDVMDDDNLVL